tara:strand:+ start:29 stop:595 length:567 start_codon:yes stop_codon:yes gene_type:complete
MVLSLSTLLCTGAWLPPSPNAARRGGSPTMGILKGISPLLTAELLYVLRSAGHGDKIAIVDANFPATAISVDTVQKEPVNLPGASTPEALDAIAAHLPIDTIVDDGVVVMLPPGDLELPPLGVEVHADGCKALEGTCGPECAVTTEVRRDDFYELARDAYCIVQTGERRPYGCFLLTVGMLGPDGKDF